MRIRLFTFILLCGLFAGLTGQGANGCDTLPTNLLGNWINTSNQEWEYGFFEDFAIYGSDFWNYKLIGNQGNNFYIVLEKEGQEVDLVLRQKKEKPLFITAAKGKKQAYFRHQKGFLPYLKPDTLRFGEPDIALDSVTILGYYRHLDRIKSEFEGSWGKYEAEVVYDDLVGKQTIQSVPIDSLGRFRLKIPVYAPHSILLDWGKLWKSFVVVPGETMMLYVDMTEFQPVGDEKNDRSAYWDRSKDILFMGEYARLHREMNYAPGYFGIRDMYELSGKTGSHMEFLRMAEADYRDYMNAFAEFHSRYPTLSARCVQVMTADAKYRFANTLMQNRFNARKKESNGFDDPAYMEYVNRHFSVDSVLYYFLLPRYEGFLRDYTGYYDDLSYVYWEGVGMCKVQRDQYANALRRLNTQEITGATEKQELEAYIALMDSIENGVYSGRDTLVIQSPEDSSLFVKYNYLRQEPVVRKMMDWLKKEEELLLFDTLISCPSLREILIAHHFAKGMMRERKPLSPELLNLLEDKVTTAAIRKPVLELDEQFRHIAQKKIAYPQSLINADDLSGIKNADSLWSALLAPYRGKVILLDFWGTWCEPCKKMITHLAPLKHDFEKEDVIFMYFAYGSPETSWKNVIREFDLSGENIVHYNLSPEQQNMIIKLRQVNAFPTYLLINRDGKIADVSIPFPVNEKELKEAIKKLLIN